MIKRLLVLILILICIVFISGCTEEPTGEVTKIGEVTTTKSTTTITTTTIIPTKDRAINVSYDELMRNTDNYIGKIVYYRGKIVQVTEVSKNEYVLRVDVTEKPYWKDTIWVNYIGKRLLEDDIIDVWGKVEGLKSYEAVLGNEVTIPEITSLELEFVTKDCGYGYEMIDGKCVEGCGYGEIRINGVCQECGSTNQPCCLNNECDYMHVCIFFGEEGICAECGGVNEICCKGDFECTYGTTCRDDKCVKCGGIGEQCCGYKDPCVIGSCEDGICVYP